MPTIDAREVDLLRVLVTPESDDPQAFLDHCITGSAWSASIRTATVTATLLARAPLGTLDQTQCTCLDLRLDRPVAVEPGLRIRIAHSQHPELRGVGVVRPWG
jgi:hypothetical protein